MYASDFINEDCFDNIATAEEFDDFSSCGCNGTRSNGCGSNGSCNRGRGRGRGRTRGHWVYVSYPCNDCYCN